MQLLKKLLNPNEQQYWDKKYEGLLDAGRVRTDGTNLDRWRPFFERASSIMDFGGGSGGNVKYLASHLKRKRFMLLDQSEVSVRYAADTLIGTSDANGNSFEYYTDPAQLPDRPIDMVMSIEVFEHIPEYRPLLDRLWQMVAPGGCLLLSVPVKGWRDRHREHVNKFTVNTMFRLLSEYADIVQIAPRTRSKRSGRLSTAYFLIEKAAERGHP